MIMYNRGNKLKTQIVNQAVKKLKAIANENRLRILYLIADRELSVGAIEKELHLSQSALSQHLAILRNYGVVKTRREAQTIFYQMNDDKTRQIIELIARIF